MSGPAVSVVIPTYNAPDLLLETLGRVFAQTFADFEVIVVDDGSTDDTPARLAAITDARLRVIRQANAGIGAARNRGIDAARGRYVCPLDHDDLWHPEKLARQVAFHDANPSLVASTVQWSTSVRPETPLIDRVSLGCDARGLVAHPVRANCFVSACLMFDRARAGGLRYETRRGAAEDLPFQFALLNAGPFGIVPPDATTGRDEPLAIYRVHAGNASGRSSYYANTARFMRELWAAGRFDNFAEADRRVVDGAFASLAQQAFARLILDGHRARAAQLAIAQARHLIRNRRFRFLAVAPFALAAPRAWVRARWRADPVMP